MGERGGGATYKNCLVFCLYQLVFSARNFKGMYIRQDYVSHTIMVAFPLFVQSYGPLIVFLCLFCVVHILVHSITHSLFVVSSYNLIGMCIRYR